jgi:hypothetical protein
VTFAEADGRTTLAILVRYDSNQDRNAHYDYMQDGLQDGLDLLEQTVISLASELSHRGRDHSAPGRESRGGV